MEVKQKFKPDLSLKLMDQVRQVLRYYQYAYRTEEVYCGWIARYLRVYDLKRHPRDMGKNEIEKFLSYLTIKRSVSAATQRQALNAIVFLYKRVLDIDISERIAPVKSKRVRTPPVVMTKQEVVKILSFLCRNNLLTARRLYGCGLRLMECVCLRVKDVDFGVNKNIHLRRKRWKKQSCSIPKNSYFRYPFPGGSGERAL